MSKRPNYDDFKKRILQDPEAKAAYDLLTPEFDVIRQFIKARKKSHCSQVELAARLDLQQPAIARLERGGYNTTTVGKLAKVADALGYTLKVTLSPKKSTIPKTKSKKV